MNAVVCSSLLLALFVYCQAQTMHPHPTHEPNEKTYVTFQYNGHTGSLLIKETIGKTYNCYVAMLSDTEKSHVHSDAGIRHLEVKYMTQLKQFMPAQVDQLGDMDVRACGHHGNATVNYFMYQSSP